jgi:hypothetical protein
MVSSNRIQIAQVDRSLNLCKGDERNAKMQLDNDVFEQNDIVVATFQCWQATLRDRAIHSSIYFCLPFCVSLSLLLMATSEVADEGVAIVRSIERGRRLSKAKWRTKRNRKKTKIKQHFAIPCVECLYSSYDIIILIHNQCSGK